MAASENQNQPWYDNIISLLNDYKQQMKDSEETIRSWNDAPGTNRQDYRDALHLQTVSQGREFMLGAGLMGVNSNIERQLMEDSANLDRRNTLDLATAEHGFNMESLRNTADLNVRQTRVEGEESRATTQLQESGATERAKISAEGQLASAKEGTEQARISDRGATERAGMGYASAEKQIGLTGSQERQTTAMGILGQVGGRYSDQNGNTYDFGRGTIGETGEQSRQTIRTQADEERRTMAFDRANAARTAIANSRR